MLKQNILVSSLLRQFSDISYISWSKWYFNEIFWCQTILQQDFLLSNDAWMRFFCFNDIKMRHLQNRYSEKCLILNWFINLKCFHPKWWNFDQTNTIFFDTSILNDFPYWDFEIRDHLLFQSHPCLL